MVTKASLFSQLLHVFPRNEFARIAKDNNAEFAAKGFTCWTQFVSMLFCQLARADSLRNICNGLPAVWASSHISVFTKPPKNPPFPTPTPSVPPNCTKTFSGLP